MWQANAVQIGRIWFFSFLVLVFICTSSHELHGKFQLAELLQDFCYRDIDSKKLICLLKIFKCELNTDYNKNTICRCIWRSTFIFQVKFHTQNVKIPNFPSKNWFFFFLVVFRKYKLLIVWLLRKAWNLLQLVMSGTEFLLHLPCT